MVGLPENYDFQELEYSEMCDSTVVKALIGPMMGGLSAVGFIAAPYGSMLRIAEGVDSLRNLVGWSLPEQPTPDQRAAALACGFAQFGGVLWLVVTLIFVALFASCSGCCGVLCLRSYRWVRGGGRKVQERDDAITELLTANLASGNIKDTDSAAGAKLASILAENRAKREIKAKGKRVVLNVPASLKKASRGDDERASLLGESSA